MSEQEKKLLGRVPEGVEVQWTHFRYAQEEVNQYLYEISINGLYRTNESWEGFEEFGSGDDPPEGGICPTGGRTECLLVRVETVLIGTDLAGLKQVAQRLCGAEAVCSPFDNFSKPMGRLISLGRALKMLEK